MAEYDTVAIVGVGLIGGSIGLALRERRLAQRVIGIGRRQQSLDVAREVGAIDHGVTNLANGVAQAQLIIVATPVDTIAERVIQASAAVPGWFADYRCGQHEGVDRFGSGCGLGRAAWRAAVRRKPSAGG